jgi:hypothetical protein
MFHRSAWWWLYESKHVATFIIDIKLVVVLLYFILSIKWNTSGWLQLKKLLHYIQFLENIMLDWKLPSQWLRVSRCDLSDYTASYPRRPQSVILLVFFQHLKHFLTSTGPSLMNVHSPEIRVSTGREFLYTLR